MTLKIISSRSWKVAWTGKGQWVIISSHLIYPLIMRVVGAPQIISQPVSYIFPFSLLPSGTWWTPGLSIPWYCLPTCFLFFFLSALSSSPFHCVLQDGLVRPDERETCAYHFSLHFFTIIRSSSCGPTACWILAQTSSLITWSLYEIRSILR